MERISRINGVKIELRRCGLEEIEAMAESRILAIEQAEQELNLLGDELLRRKTEYGTDDGTE